MKKTALLSAVSAIALAVSAPAQAFDSVDWDWTHNTYTDVDAFFDIDVDFVAWGLTQVERLQVMAGNMTAYADGSYASYTDTNGKYVMPVAPVYIVNKQNVDQSITQTAANTASVDGGGPGALLPTLIDTNGSIHHILSEQGPGDNNVDVIIKNNDLTLDLGDDIEQSIDQDASNVAKQYNTIVLKMDQIKPYYVAPIDARKHLAKVEIAATAISNVASVEGEHVTMVHDGQVAFGKFNPVDGIYYEGYKADDEEQASLANLALADWIGADYYGKFEGSGNRNYDMLMLGWTAAQYGLIDKGYNSAYAFGDYISDAQVDVSATAAANIHTVSLGSRLEPTDDGYSNHHWGDPTIGTDNVAMVDLNQFGYQDTFAYSSAVGHSISGYSYLGKLEAPALKVTASALGNVSTVTNKFVPADNGGN